MPGSLTPSPPGFMTRAEYARHRGTSWQAVNKKIKRNELLLLDGALLNVADSDAAWPFVDTLRQDNGLQVRAAPAPTEKAAPQGDTPDGEAGDISYERLLHERAKRKLAEKKLDAAEGRLVDVDAVKKEWFAATRAVRDALLAIPDDLSADLAAETETRKVRVMLDTAIRSRLADLSHDETGAGS